jgi:hypothetical protein
MGVLLIRYWFLDQDYLEHAPQLLQCKATASCSVSCDSLVIVLRSVLDELVLNFRETAA